MSGLLNRLELFFLRFVFLGGFVFSYEFFLGLGLSFESRVSGTLLKGVVTG